MKKLKKLIYVGCPWFFGTILVISGLVVFYKGFEERFIHATILTCAGLVCLSIWCVCSILVEVLEGKRS